MTSLGTKWLVAIIKKWCQEALEQLLNSLFILMYFDLHNFLENEFAKPVIRGKRK